VRPGFELGYKEDGKFYIFNHLQFNILVHPTHGEYMRARQGFRDAAVLDNIDARRMLLSRKQLLAAGASEAALGSSSSSSRQLAADDKAAAGERGWCNH
jgi:transmembrane 9 superfamily protein 2/4